MTYLNLSLWKKVPAGKYKEYDQIIKNNIKKYRISIIKNKKVNKKPKYMMILSFLGRRIYRPIIVRVKK